MQVSIVPFFTLSLADPVLACADVRRPRIAAAPTRRTVEQLHRDIGRSRYSGATLRRIRSDPRRAECSRRRAIALEHRSA